MPAVPASQSGIHTQAGSHSLPACPNSDPHSGRHSTHDHPHTSELACNTDPVYGRGTGQGCLPIENTTQKHWALNIWARRPICQHRAFKQTSTGHSTCVNKMSSTWTTRIPLHSPHLHWWCSTQNLNKTNKAGLTYIQDPPQYHTSE